MGTELGQALMGIGQQIPGMFAAERKRRQEEELSPLQKRMALANLQRAETDLSISEEERQRIKESRRLLEESIGMVSGKQPGMEFPEVGKPEFSPTAGMAGSPQAGMAGLSLKAEDLQGKYGLPKAGEIPEATEIKTRPSLAEALFQTGAATRMDAPEVAGFVKQFVPDINNRGMGRSATATRLQLATPENIAKAQAIVDKMEQSGSFDQITIDSARQLAEVDPIKFLYDSTGKALSVDQAVRQFETITPLAEERAGRTQYAGTIAGKKAEVEGPKKLTEKDKTEMASLRGVYADISDAKKYFDPKFAVPYFGKLFKISQLKQLDPKFAKFISSLERGVAKYRKENFGAAQTGIEISKLKDMVDQDLSVDPEVFIAQIDNFLRTTERDYNDKLTYYKEYNVPVPESFKTIKIGEGKGTEQAQGETAEQKPKKKRFTIISVE